MDFCSEKIETQGKTGFHVELSIIAFLRHKTVKGEFCFSFTTSFPKGVSDQVLRQESEMGIYRNHNSTVWMASLLTYLKQQQVIDRDKCKIRLTCKDNGLSPVYSYCRNCGVFFTRIPSIWDSNIEKSRFGIKNMESWTVATDELLKMAQTDAPLWSSSATGEWDTLNEDEYMKIIHNAIFRRKYAGHVTDASKKTCTVMKHSSSIISTLMNSDEWAETFPSMVKKASTIELISSELKKMAAELQVLSPLVPVRKVEFHRYSKRHDNGVWTVVDAPILTFMEDSFAMPECERLPSGCVVQDMPHGYSKIIWVEHVRYGEHAIHHLYRSLIKSGNGFGAPRWIATFQRTLHRTILQESSGVPIGNETAMVAKERRYLLKLAAHMTRAFCAVVCPSSEHYADENLRMTIGASMVNSGEPATTLVSAAASHKLFQFPQRLFDLLLDEKIRQQCGLDNIALQKEYHISTGEDGNNVTLLRPMMGGLKWVLQETCRDEFGALVVVMTIDPLTVDNVLKCGDFTNIPLVLSGYAIEPDQVVPLAPPMSRGPFHDAKASLLTVFKQNLVGHPEVDPQETMKKYSKFMAKNLESIKKGLDIVDSLR